MKRQQTINFNPILVLYAPDQVVAVTLNKRGGLIDIKRAQIDYSIASYLKIDDEEDRVVPNSTELCYQDSQFYLFANCEEECEESSESEGDTAIMKRMTKA